jgi:hypothetical protein
MLPFALHGIGVELYLYLLFRDIIRLQRQKTYDLGVKYQIADNDFTSLLKDTGRGISGCSCSRDDSFAGDGLLSSSGLGCSSSV